MAYPYPMTGGMVNPTDVITETPQAPSPVHIALQEQLQRLGQWRAELGNEERMVERRLAEIRRDIERLNTAINGIDSAVHPPPSAAVSGTDALKSSGYGHS